MSNSRRCSTRERTHAGLALGAVAALSIQVTFGLSSPAHAAVVEQLDPVSGITFTINDEDPAAGATATRYDASRSGPSVEIPGEVVVGGETYPVTTIGPAFNYQPITSVEIPEGVVSIGANAFSNSKLTNVVIPEGVTSIGSYAFGTTPLETAIFPSGLESIGEYAFNSTKLTSVELPESVTSIGDMAFYNGQLELLDLPERDVSIGAYAFSGNQLTEINLPVDMTTIRTGAFSSNKLTSIDLPETLVGISDSAFAHNPLTSVTIPPRVSSIMTRAFGYKSDTYEHTLTEVRFLGPAPKTFADGSDAHTNGAFGKTQDVVITFPGEYLADEDPTKVFTEPLWKGYKTQATKYISGLKILGADSVSEGSTHDYAVTSVDALGNVVDDVTHEVTLTLGGVEQDGSAVEFPTDYNNAGLTTTQTMTATLNEDSTKVGELEVSVASTIHQLRIDQPVATEDGVAADGETVAFTVVGLGAAAQGRNSDAVAAVAVASAEIDDVTGYATFSSTNAADTAEGNEITFVGPGEREVSATVGGLTETITVVVDGTDSPEVEGQEPEGEKPGVNGDNGANAGSGGALANTGSEATPLLIALGGGACVLLALGLLVTARRRRIG